LFGIPVIGWLVCLIYAIGGTKYQNKRNFARAVIAMILIGAVVSFLVYFVLRWAFGMAIGAAVESTGGDGGGLLAVKQLLESLLEYVNGLIAARGQS